MLKPVAVQERLERWQVDFVAAVALRFGRGVARFAATLAANADSDGLASLPVPAGERAVVWPVIRRLELDGFLTGVRAVSGGVECELVQDRGTRAQLRLLLTGILA